MSKEQIQALQERAKELEAQLSAAMERAKELEAQLTAAPKKIQVPKNVKECDTMGKLAAFLLSQYKPDAPITNNTRTLLSIQLVQFGKYKK